MFLLIQGLIFASYMQGGSETRLCIETPCKPVEDGLMVPFAKRHPFSGKTIVELDKIQEINVTFAARN